jgi:hypothetical protein
MIKNFTKLSYIITLFTTMIVQGDYLSDFVDEPFYRLCTICEKALINSGRNIKELNNDIIQVFGKSTFLRKYLYHNDRDFTDCCEIFYFIKNFKDSSLTAKEQKLTLFVTEVALNYLMKHLYVFSFPEYKLSEEDIHFVNNLNLKSYREQCTPLALKIPTEEASNTPSKTEENTPIPNTKIDSCALL